MLRKQLMLYKSGMHYQYAALCVSQWEASEDVQAVAKRAAELLAEFRLLAETKQTLLVETRDYSLHQEIEDLFAANKAISAFYYRLQRYSTTKSQIVDVADAAEKKNEQDQQRYREESNNNASERIQTLQSGLQRLMQIKLQAALQRDEPAVQMCQRKEREIREKLQEAIKSLQ